MKGERGMQLDFDVDNIQKNSIDLLNCQVDLILRSLEFYCYTYNFIYPRSHKNTSKEENLRLSLVRDTYHQILFQYKNKTVKSLIPENEILKGFETNFESVA